MITERDPIYGTWKCYDIVCGTYVHMTYYGCTKQEAEILFAEYVESRFPGATDTLEYWMNAK